MTLPEAWSPAHRGHGGEAQDNDLLRQAIYCPHSIPDVHLQYLAARCQGEGTIARGSAPVLALCRALIKAGHDPAKPLEAWRGDTLALRVRTIGEGARLRVATHCVGFETIPECTRGPPVRRIESTSIKARPDGKRFREAARARRGECPS